MAGVSSWLVWAFSDVRCSVRTTLCEVARLTRAAACLYGGDSLRRRCAFEQARSSIADGHGEVTTFCCDCTHVRTPPLRAHCVFDPPCLRGLVRFVFPLFLRC